MLSTPGIKPLSKSEPTAESPCETEASFSTEGGEEDHNSSDCQNDGMSHGNGSSSILVLNYAFTFSMAVLGVLDILGTLLPAYVQNAFANSEEALTGVAIDPYTEYSELPQEFLNFVKWLDDKDITISFIFAALWFANTFFDASVLRNKALIKAERKHLDADGKDEVQKKTKFWKTPTFVYFRQIFMQLMLLPVGFYFIVYAEILYASLGERIDDIDLINDSVVLEVSDREDVVQYETFSAQSKIALLFAISRHLWLKWLKLSGTTTSIAKSNAVSFLKSVGPTAVRKILGKAIRNPIKFRRRLQKLMTAIRWLKYIAPLIGTCNKLKGNVKELLKRRRQLITAQKQKLVRQRLFEKKPLKLKRKDAAKIIQSTWRAYRTRKATRAVLILRGDRQYDAALKVQGQFRRKLAEARVRIQKKQEELQRLERIHNKNVKRLSDADKKRMYDLQDELGREARKLVNRKLLLRPNTRFAVIWKYLFVFCVIFEIANLIIRPILKGSKSRRNGGEIGMNEFVADHIVPTRVSDLPECLDFVKNLSKIEAQKQPLFCNGNCQMKQYGQRRKLIADLEITQPWYCKEPVSSVQEGFRDVVALLLVPSEVSEWPECQVHREENSGSKRSRRAKNEKDSSWYCAKPYPKVHSMYRRIVDFFQDECLIFVSIICFLDVFVNFFIGEFHPENGILTPKPYFVRWIMPGLVLQLLVNPNIEAVSTFVEEAWQEMVKLGPVRVYRWNVAVVFPIVYLSWNLFMEWVWMPLVHCENTLRPIASSLN
jgi:hypothetical protein